jgi:hypothetical protein
VLDAKNPEMARIAGVVEGSVTRLTC